jgi:hypothetical protein
MSARWKLLGPLEAVNGALMIGLSGACMLAVMQHHIRKQLKYEMNSMSLFLQAPKRRKPESLLIQAF